MTSTSDGLGQDCSGKYRQIKINVERGLKSEKGCVKLLSI